MTDKQKFEHRKCFICKGEKFSYLGLRDLHGKLRWVKTICFHCLGKGYIKIKKDK